MFTLLFVLVFLTSYLAIGAKYSRQRYALLAAEQKKQSLDFVQVEKNRARLKELQTALVTMRRSTRVPELSQWHKGTCDKIHYPNIGTCDCGAVKSAADEINKLTLMLAGSIDEPDVFKPVVFWPIYKSRDYLTSGEIPKTQDDIIAELEAEAFATRELEHMR